MASGKFITVEGIDGAGKSTHLERIETLIRNAGFEVVTTREPGGTALGERLREALLHADGVTISARAETLAMFAARAQHLDEVIEPTLASDAWVLCDRFADASYAYQGGGRKLGLEVVAQLHALMGIDLQPNLTFLLDMPIEEGLKRMAQRGKPDRIEKEKLDFFERARAAYLHQAKTQPDRVKLIDASQTLEAVQLQVTGVLNEFLDNHSG